MSDSNISREAVDQILSEQTQDAAQDALQAALDTHRALKQAQAEFDQAPTTLALAQARRDHAEACAKLLPFQRMARVAA